MSPDSLPQLRRHALKLAQTQHGVVARRQLIDRGVAARTIHNGVGRRFLFPVVRGVYAVGRPEISVHGLWLACVLACGPAAVLAGATAAIAWGFADRPKSPVSVIRPGHDRYSSPVLLKPHGHGFGVRYEVGRCRWLRSEHVTRLQGIPILHLEPLLLQLSAQLTPDRFQYAFWEADRKRGLDEARLDRCVELSQGMRGGAKFREAVDCRLPHIEEALSLLEVLLMDLGRQGRIPAPQVNRDEEGHLVDFRWPQHRLIVEADGYEYHRGHGAFERDAVRDNDLRAKGWTVLRFTYRMLKYQPDYVVKTILNAFESHSPIVLAAA